jgi:hypothetical protein
MASRVGQRLLRGYSSHSMCAYRQTRTLVSAREFVQAARRVESYFSLEMALARIPREPATPVSLDDAQGVPEVCTGADGQPIIAPAPNEL